MFGPNTESAVRYAELLATVGVARGLLGPREANVVWSRHILNCAALLPFLTGARDVVDLGSGAGLPGIVVALARPDLAVTLLEPMARRCTFLSEVVAELGLDRVTVVRARAEELVGALRTDVVVARAVAPLPRLLGWAAPLLRPGGALLALKGQNATAEVSAARAELARRDARADISVVNAPGTGQPTTVVHVVVEAPD